MDLKELQAECDKLKLKKYGTKAALIERISNFKKQHAEEEEANHELNLRLDLSTSRKLLRLCSVLKTNAMAS